MLLLGGVRYTLGSHEVNSFNSLLEITGTTCHLESFWSVWRESSPVETVYRPFFTRGVNYGYGLRFEASFVVKNLKKYVSVMNSSL